MTIAAAKSIFKTVLKTIPELIAFVGFGVIFINSCLLLQFYKTQPDLVEYINKSYLHLGVAIPTTLVMIGIIVFIGRRSESS